MLERIVYVSRAARAVGMPEICGIIRAAHHHNGTTGVTGALIALDGWFVQGIEGPAAAVEATFARILRDPRHHAVALRSREPALCRLFPGQAMALRTRSGLGEALLAEVGYRPGFPVGDFPAAHLLEFLVTACRQRVLALAPASAAGRAGPGHPPPAGGPDGPDAVARPVAGRMR
jgi:hypothetical protein